MRADFQPYLPLLTALVVSLPGILAYFRVGKVAAQVQEVHLSINSRLDKMLEITGQEAHQRGMAEGTAAEKRRVSDRAAAHAEGRLEERGAEVPHVQQVQLSLGSPPGESGAAPPPPENPPGAGL